MKTVIQRFKELQGTLLLLVPLSFLVFSCSFEELAEPFPALGECEDISSGGFFSITIDTDTVLWSSGMYENGEVSVLISDEHKKITTIKAE